MADCTQYDTLVEFWTHGELWDGFWCALTDSGAASEFLIGFWVLASIGLAFYVHGDSMVLPVVVLILMAGVAASFLPGPVATVASIAAVAILAGAIIIAVRRMR